MADLGGVVIGGVLTVAGSFGAKLWDDRRQSKSLHAAFRAEVTMIPRGAEARGHEDVFRRYVEQWEKTKTELPIISWSFGKTPADHALDANVDELAIRQRLIPGSISCRAPKAASTSAPMGASPSCSPRRRRGTWQQRVLY